MYQVKKRDGSIVKFDIAKISAAITKAFDAQGRQRHPCVIDMLALRVTAEFEPKIRDGLISVEDIQDSAEKVLSEAGYFDVAKAYILYRRQRENVRNAGGTLLNYKDLVNNYLQINDWRVKENSTVTYSVGGLIINSSLSSFGCAAPPWFCRKLKIKISFFSFVKISFSNFTCGYLRRMLIKSFASS